MKRIGGFEKLIDQACEHLAGAISCMDDVMPGDSAIERLFISSLAVYCKIGACGFDRVRSVSSEELERAKTQEHPREWLLIQRQVQLSFGRVDFVVHAYDEGLKAWKALVVECDGHDFHERTKEQAAKDRSRDREAQLAGYGVFRFTGSELWRDPWACAAKVAAWGGRADQ